MKIGKLANRVKSWNLDSRPKPPAWRFRKKIEFPVQPAEIKGICACGCGKKTQQARYDQGRQRKGEFARFLPGHMWKLRRRLLGKTADWKSSFEILQERDELRIKLASEARKLARTAKTPSFEELRRQMGGVIEVAGHAVSNQGISRMLTMTGFEGKLITPKIVQVKPPEISIFYPYLASARNNEEQMVLAVNAVVPLGISNDARADICQDLLLALVAGDIALADLRRQAPEYIRKFFRRFGHKGNILSLDAPINGDPSRSSLYDLIDAARCGELHRLT